MNKKWMLTNIGVAGALGLSAFGVTYATTRPNHDHVGEFQSINDILDDVSSLYDAHAEHVQITEDNKNDLAKILQTTIDGVKKDIQSKTDEDLAGHKNDIEDALETISVTLEKNDNFTREALDTIFAEIGDLKTKTNSIDNIIDDYKLKIEDIKNNIADKTNEFGERFTTLQNSISSLSAYLQNNVQTVDKLKANQDDIVGAIDSINASLIGVDQLRQEMTAANSTISVLLTRLNEVEEFVKNHNDYDNTDLKDRISALEENQTNLEQSIGGLTQKMDDIFAKYSDVSSKIDNYQNATDKDLADIKNDISEIKTNIVDHKKDFTDFKKDMKSNTDKIESNINSLFNGYENLEVKINGVSNQTDKLADDMLELQLKIDELSDRFDIEGSKTIHIKKDDTIYKYENKKSELNYLDIEVPKLSKAKRISLQTTITNTKTNVEISTNLVDSFPSYGISLVGNAYTIGTKSFLTSLGLSNNTISIEGLWFNNRNSVWKAITKEKEYSLKLTDVIVSY